MSLMPFSPARDFGCTFSFSSLVAFSLVPIVALLSLGSRSPSLYHAPTPAIHLTVSLLYPPAPPEPLYPPFSLLYLDDTAAFHDMTRLDPKEAS